MEIDFEPRESGHDGMALMLRAAAYPGMIAYTSERWKTEPLH